MSIIYILESRTTKPNEPNRPDGPEAQTFACYQTKHDFHCIYDRLFGTIHHMESRSREWLLQSDYDMNTAEYMYSGDRHVYAVFMCHLSIEKALKGLYFEKQLSIPPKSHNLIYLINKIGIKPPAEIGKFVVKLNEVSIATRYPENLIKLQQLYTRAVVEDILIRGKEAIAWIKQQF